jgi:hypothetical protein
MFKLLYTSTLITLFSFQIFGQFTLLKNIDGGNADGLTSSFDFRKDNNAIFFTGTVDGFDRSLWKTDGTSSGTTQAVSSSKINAADEIYFTSNGIFISDFNSGRKLLISKGTDASTNPISFFDGINIGEPYTMGKSTIFIGSSTKEIYITNGTNAGSGIIRTLNKTNYNLEITTNDSLAIIFDSYSFGPDFEPFIYSDKTKTTVDLKDYLKSYLNATKIKYGYIFKDIIMFQAIVDGGQSNYVFNVNTKKIGPFEYTDKLLGSHVLANGNFLIHSRSSVFSINPSTLAFDEISSDADFFSPSYFKDGKLYFITSNFNDRIYSVTDGTVAGTKDLKNTTIGDSYYESKCIVINNNFYYLKDTISTTSKIDLMKYNLTSNTISKVGIVSETTGGSVISHDMVEVNEMLLISRYTQALGHELYSYNASPTATFEPNSDGISVYPSIVNGLLTIESEVSTKSVKIFNTQGKLVLEKNIDFLNEFSLNVNELSSDIYIIYLSFSNGKSGTSKFFKTKN